MIETIRIPVAVTSGGAAAIRDLTLKAAAAPGLRPTADLDYGEQPALVDGYVNAIVQESPLAPFVAPSTGCVGADVNIDPPGAVNGTSHGLALLLGALCHRLGIQPRVDVVFSAALAPGAPNTINLKPVRDIRLKAQAAARRELRRLYYVIDENNDHAEFEALRRYQLAYSRGDAEHTCEVVALPTPFSWANLVNLGANLGRFWELALSRDEPPAVIALAEHLLITALHATSAPGEYPEGVGRALATIRQRGQLSADCAERLWSIGLKRCPDEHLCDFVKIGLSEDAARSIEEDFRCWVRRETTATEIAIESMPLPQAISLLDLGVANDWLSDEDAREVERVLSRRFDELADQASTAPELRTIAATLSALAGTRLSHAILLERFQRAVHSEKLRRFASSLPELRKAYVLAVRRLIGVPVSATVPLTLTFRPLDRDTIPTCPRCRDHPIVPILNDLGVAYSDGQRLEVVVPSPVLLVETGGRSSYTRRRDYCAADVTLARYPEKDVSFIYAAFATQPNRIQFDLSCSTGSHRFAGVVWDSVRVAFPPAIDSQLLAWSIVRDRALIPNDHPVHSLCDIGCGTGFLAAIATGVFPSARDVSLVDIDFPTVASAAENLRTSISSIEPGGHETRELLIHLEPNGFSRYRGKRVDLAVCNPPYLPELHISANGFERAVNGTQLLRDVVRRGPDVAKYLWITFSALAWPDFEQAIMPIRSNVSRIVVTLRTLAPLRITTIEPVPPSESNERNAESQFERNRRYYDSVLRPRGLIDLDDEAMWRNLDTLVENSGARLFRGTDQSESLNDLSGLNKVELRRQLNILRQDSRGFRFWHETRVVFIEFV